MSSHIKLVESRKLIEDQSMATNFTLNMPEKLAIVEGFSLQFIWSSGVGLSGNIRVRASNDGVNYTNISGATFNIVNNADNGILNFYSFHYNYFTIEYTATSGTGNMTIIYNSRGRID
jgi:hypothetical protein